MDKDIIRRVVRSHLGEVSRCYEGALGRNPKAKGRVAIKFTIGPEGPIIASEAASSEIDDPVLVDCIVTATLTWVFPKPEGNGNIVVTYPFLLSSDEPPPAAAKPKQ